MKTDLFLPNKKPAESDQQYVDEWRAFAKPLAAALDMEPYGFDPGVSYTGKEGDGRGHIQLPAWAIARINKALKPCSKCKGSRMVTDAGLQLVAMIKGEPIPEPTVYPCPNCCKELHAAVAKEYKKRRKGPKI